MLLRLYYVHEKSSKKSNELTGSKRSRTTAYNPQSNSMVERFHRHLKSALKAQPNPSAWMDPLPFVILGICTAVKLTSPQQLLSAIFFYLKGAQSVDDFVADCRRLGE